MIFIIRHGSSKKSKRNIDEWSNIPLNSRGINESRKLARWLSSNKNKYNKIYSSDIKRAMQTASIISKELQLKVKPLKQLREFRINYKKSEKLVHMQNRIQRLMLSRVFSINQNNIIVTHKGIIREILKQNRKYKAPFKIKIEPGTLFIITRNKKCKKIVIRTKRIHRRP